MAIKRLAAIILLAGRVAVNVSAANPALTGQTRTWRSEHEREILAEFTQFVAMPNLATDAPNIQHNVAAIRVMCERRGLAVRSLGLEGAPPIIIAELRVPQSKRTIAFYAHYDGQPVDPARWKSAPWSPVMRDASGKDVDWYSAKAVDPEWRLYGRSAGDDKAAIIALMAALDALRAANISPSVNLRFVFEGEEEAGSPHLAAYLQKYPDALRPDAWILCDGPVHQSRRMELFFGARGVVDLELTLYGPAKGLHDGHYGNWVANPAAGLAHLIASMRDDSGRLLIKGFEENVRPPEPAERAALAQIPNIEAELRREFQIAANEGDGKSLNELLMLPALNLRGLEAGQVGARASNTIATEARASLDFRLVPNETPETIKPLVENHLRARGYELVRETPDTAARLKHPKLLRVEWGNGYPPARTPLDLPSRAKWPRS